MTNDKEFEIRLQFLEEATEYLGTIESVVLELSSGRIDNQKMDAVLRAAHSIKGGAAMMGFETLSSVAHRLEDFFKIIKIQRNSIEIDAELERLLLAGVDCLQQVVESDRSGIKVGDEWLDIHANPVFEQLHQRLGDPQDEDASTMLAPEEGEDIVGLLFETEVEGCLQRLEGVLANPDKPCLLEEVSIMAQELEGLGEMLQLPAFSSLCESVTQHLEAAPNQVEEIAVLALQEWRRSRAMVLVGSRDTLPTKLELFDLPETANDYQTIQPIETEEQISATWLEEEQVAASWSEEEQLAASWSEEEQLATSWSEEKQVAANWSEEEQLATTLSAEEQVAAAFNFSQTEFEPIYVSSTSDEVEVIIEAVNSTEEVPLELEIVDAVPTAITPLSRDVQTPDFQIAERKTEPVSADRDRNKESQENTVRVPIKQLDRLNDLFGELTIERNGLNLHLDRLRKLLGILSRKVRNLERSNIGLRTAYDKVGTQPPVSSGVPISMGAASPNGYSFGRESSDRSNSDNFDTLNPDEVKGINNRFDRLEMDRYNDLHSLSLEVMETIVQIQEVTGDVELSLEDTEQTSTNLNRTAKQLQNSLTQARMRPLSDVLSRFPRALRDLCLEYGKNVELKIHGGETLIDRTILEALNAPLMHLLRNAFDHGIEDPATRLALGKPEQGVIEIRALNRGNQTLIIIKDNGSGIDLGKIQARAERMGLDPSLLAAASDQELLSLIFEPGFSTADRVTALSGRGVGLDVVRANLKQIRGDIKVDTEQGIGSTFTLSLPFTLSVASILLVEVGGMQLAFPTDAVEEMVLLKPEQICITANKEVLNWQDYMVPLIRLGNWLQFRCPHKSIDTEIMPLVNVPTVLMTTQNNQLFGIQVDRCWGEQEVAIRQVEGIISLPPGFTGCTILGDGRVVPLINVSEMLHWVASCEQAYKSPPADITPDKLLPPSIPVTQKETILVVDDSTNVRRFLALLLEKAGYQVEQAKDGQDALEKLLNGVQVQAVICDIEMPRLDGYGFLSRVRSESNFKELPIAMLTSRSGDKHRQLAMNLGATAYFSKPYNEQELLKTLKQLVNH